jgi:predicted phosphoribosyltransferase
MDEIERRLNIFRPGYSLPDMKGKTVIIVDDGIATGATFVPVLQLCKKRGAHRLIVAAPVSGHKVVPELYEVADEVLILEKPEIFNGVAQVYDDFKELTDEQVMKFLKNNESI